MHQPLCQEKKTLQIYRVDIILDEAFAHSYLGETYSRCICSRTSDLYYTFFTSEEKVTVTATTGNNIDTRNGNHVDITDHSVSFMI